MNRPFFSVIIPIYNTAQNYLDFCMRSLLNQTFSDIQILLVDDGSQQDCARLCDRYAEADCRVSVIHQENQGVSVARNNGIKAAQGNWIMFVDADDWMELDACERLKQYLDHCECDMLQFNALNEFASKQSPMNYGFEHGRLYDLSDVDNRILFYRRTMQPPNTKEETFCTLYYSWDKVFKRSFLIDNHLEYPVGIPKSEDKIFILCCLEKLGKLYYVRDALYHYRINSTSACRKYSEKADTNCLILGEQLMKVAERMDRELGLLKGDLKYHQITDDCKRFIFGILTDVLAQKFFHPEYPYDSTRRSAELKRFLDTDPVKSSIQSCKYSELPFEAKLKKFLFSIGQVSLFLKIREFYRRLMRANAE